MITDKHLFCDVYGVKKENLDDISKIKAFTKTINKIFFEEKGKVVLIPYFHGKIKEDGGISTIILGDNKHFTCHTFCYKNTAFIDYFGVSGDADRRTMEEKILAAFESDDYDLCDCNKGLKGNFGKHIIIKPKKMLSFEEATRLVSRILVEINMTPINEQIINFRDEKNYDILQPIAESHISFHRVGDEMVIDAFSCKYFDEQKLLKILGDSGNFVQVNREIKYK